MKEKKSRQSLAVYHHPHCQLHQVQERAPEAPARTKELLLALQATLPSTIPFREGLPIYDNDIILLFHTERYLESFYAIAEEVQLPPPVAPSALPAPVKSSTRGSSSGNSGNGVKFKALDAFGDSKMMHHTKEAAFAAVGCVVTGIQGLFLPENHPEHVEIAFCCIRPPGHHAEPDSTGGFCFFNNVGIGARYMQRAYDVQRVAVLDFDVHHGNGTEAGFLRDKTLFYGSTHEQGIYPDTGAEDKRRGHRIVNRFLTAGPASRQQFRDAWEEILEAMEAFRPEAVIISAGFDAHIEDRISHTELIDEDFVWITRRILWSACRLGNLPVLSVLEGGYNVNCLARCCTQHVEVLSAGYAGLYPFYGALPTMLPTGWNSAAAESSAETDSEEESEQEADREKKLHATSALGNGAEDRPVIKPNVKQQQQKEEDLELAQTLLMLNSVPTSSLSGGGSIPSSSFFLPSPQQNVSAKSNSSQGIPSTGTQDTKATSAFTFTAASMPPNTHSSNGEDLWRWPPHLAAGLPFPMGLPPGFSMPLGPPNAASPHALWSQAAMDRGTVLSKENQALLLKDLEHVHKRTRKI